MPCKKQSILKCTLCLFLLTLWPPPKSSLNLMTLGHIRLCFSNVDEEEIRRGVGLLGEALDQCRKRGLETREADKKANGKEEETE